MTKFLNISTDNTLGGSSASDDTVASQKAVKDYIDAHSGGANTDLSNLTSQGQNIANWSSNVTNCITEIPQDIKLELNNGTLTLKAGSKVYVPNGAGVFDTVTVASDISGNYSSITTDYVFFYHTSGALGAGQLTQMNSGTTAPTSPVNGTWWYDTTNNLVKRYNGSSWTQNYSLPICILSTGGSSINQVFNGFGYIGSTVFALPNVKGFIPNGRNEDGSLKNIEFTTSSVITRSWTTQSAEGIFMLNVTPTSGLPYLTIRPIAKYDEISNKLINVGDLYEADVGFAKLVSGSITSFTPKTAFHALDYNDSSTISGWAMPSSRYIDLTLGASGTTYTAPANGYFSVTGVSKTTNAYVDLTLAAENGSDLIHSFSGFPLSGYWCSAFVPAKKNRQVRLRYGNMQVAGDTYPLSFKFIYADGEE